LGAKWLCSRFRIKEVDSLWKEGSRNIKWKNVTIIKEETMIVYPVGPTRTSKGALLSLTSVLTPEEAMPVPLETGTNPYTSFRIAGEQVSIAASAKLDVAAVFKGSASFNERGFVFDAVAYVDQYAQNSSSPVVMTRWGSGMRVAVRLMDLKIDVAGSFGSIAATAQLGLGRAQYEILGLGLGLDALTAILADLPPMGEFGLDAYTKLTTSIYGALKNYITDHRNDLTPVPFAVGLKDSIEHDPVTDARSVYLAVYWRKMIGVMIGVKSAVDSYLVLR